MVKTHRPPEKQARSPVRFVHTSDIHLDTSFASAGFPSKIGHRKREAIRATFRRILEEARRDAVDFVLVAGDLFEHDRVTPDTVEFLKRQFADLGQIPVFIAPGNHDPFLRGSPYAEESWPANVHIFREEEFRAVMIPSSGVRVTGFAYTRAQYPESPFARLDPLPADALNIVLCHASDLGRIPAGKTCHGPFRGAEVAGKNATYVALGHYHHQRAVEGVGEGTAVWYSGIPEGRGWDEEGQRGYLLVTIDGGNPVIESRPCARHPLATVSLSCEEFTTREQIVDAVVAGRGDLFDESTILRVRLQGDLDPRLDLSFPELDERLAGQALHFVWEDRTRPALDFDALALENTLLGQFVRAMNARVAGAAPEDAEKLARARLYGAESLLGREVVPR